MHKENRHYQMSIKGIIILQKLTYFQIWSCYIQLESS